MNTTLLTLLVSLAVVTMVSARFSCGHDPLQSGFAELLIKNDCKGRLNKVDTCCAQHTKCYEKKTPRNVCDEAFCKCSKKAAKNLPLCNLQMDNFCNTAKNFGGFHFKG
uniref:DB domain-containing protein n=1 Tax=Caenorhabditis tropicalis TaxID=1561998 RepID=A0A1I7V1S9_9PELO